MWCFFALECVESWKLKVESWKLSNFPFSIFHFQLRTSFAWWRWWDSTLARTARSVIRRKNSSTGRVFYTAPTSNPAFYLAELKAPIHLWWRWWDSNPWPPACRAGALPAELHPHIKWFVVFSVYFREVFYFAGRPKWTRTTDLVLIRHAL